MGFLKHFENGIQKKMVRRIKRRKDDFITAELFYRSWEFYCEMGRGIILPTKYVFRYYTLEKLKNSSPETIQMVLNYDPSKQIVLANPITESIDLLQVYTDKKYHGFKKRMEIE